MRKETWLHIQQPHPVEPETSRMPGWIRKHRTLLDLIRRFLHGVCKYICRGSPRALNSPSRWLLRAVSSIRQSIKAAPREEPCATMFELGSVAGSGTLWRQYPEDFGVLKAQSLQVTECHKALLKNKNYSNIIGLELGHLQLGNETR